MGKIRPFLLLASSLLLACTGQHGHGAGDGEVEWFTSSVEGLPMATAPETRELKDGDTVILTASPVKKVLQGKEVRMLAYNGSIPGPVLKAPQGARVTVRLRNRIGLPTTLHPHGLRLDNAFDGAPDLQTPIADGDSFDYQLTFPDPGPFWYHPHVRESYGLEMGLYGAIIVAPRDTAYWYPATREIPLILDDVLMDGKGILPHRKDGADHAMMGRFGNVFLANGDTDLVIHAKRNEVIRFYHTNACNSRTLFLGYFTKSTNGVYLPRSMRPAGSDMGQFQMIMTTPWELLSPGERYAAEIHIADTSTLYLLHNILVDGVIRKSFRLATVKVSSDSAEADLSGAFYQQTENPLAIASIDSVRAEFDRPPDKRLRLTIRMSHVHLAKQADDPGGKGIEWEDKPTMGLPNSSSTLANTQWIIRDSETGKENHDIVWKFKRGEKVMIRIYNDSTSMHPMPHPIHFHGQRFLVVNINGVRNTVHHMAWKDTYLVGRGETADILLDASNPGKWMAHCHIAEHLETMMMFNYTVE